MKAIEKQIRAARSMPFRHGSGWAYSVKRPDGGKNCTQIVSTSGGYHDCLAARRQNIEDEIYAAELEAQNAE